VFDYLLLILDLPVTTPHQHILKQAPEATFLMTMSTTGLLKQTAAVQGNHHFLLKVGSLLRHILLAV
jgi:hypothetical protein